MDSNQKSYVTVLSSMNDDVTSSTYFLPFWAIRNASLGLLWEQFLQPVVHLLDRVGPLPGREAVVVLAANQVVESRLSNQRLIDIFSI